MQLRLQGPSHRTLERAAERPARFRWPRFWLTAMAVVGLVGGGMALASATDTHWYTDVSVSRLGMDPGASGILNATLLLLATLLATLGLSLEATVTRLRSARRL